MDKGNRSTATGARLFGPRAFFDFCREISPSPAFAFPSNFHFHAVIGGDVRAGMENQAGMGKPSVVAEVTAYT